MFFLVTQDRVLQQNTDTLLDKWQFHTLKTISESNNNKTNDLILNLTPENVTQHSRIE